MGWNVRERQMAPPARPLPNHPRYSLIAAHQGVEHQEAHILRFPVPPAIQYSLRVGGEMGRFFQRGEQTPRDARRMACPETPETAGTKSRPWHPCGKARTLE